MEKTSSTIEKVQMMFCPNNKKRMNAIKCLHNIISENYSAKNQKDLINICEGFLDDEPQVMKAALNQLNILEKLQLSEYSKLLWIQLLVKFCKLDQNQIALKAVQIIQKLTQNDGWVYFEAISLLKDSSMATSILSLVTLIVDKIQFYKDQQQIKLLRILKDIVQNKNYSLSLIVCKNLSALVLNAHRVDFICELFDSILQQESQLAQLLCIQPLIIFYKKNPKFSINKLKLLFEKGNWRVKIGLCQHSDIMGKIISNFHFKDNFQTHFLQMLLSKQEDIRISAIKALPALAKNMDHDEISNKLSQIIKFLVKKSNQQTKNELGKVALNLTFDFCKQKQRQFLNLILISINVQDKFEILCEFFLLAKQKTSDSKPILTELQNLVVSLKQIDDWKIDLRILNKALRFSKKPETFCIFGCSNWISYLQKNLLSRINKVREQAQKNLIQIIKQNKFLDVQKLIISTLQKLKNHSIYSVRQRVISTITDTPSYMRPSTFNKAKNIYKDLLNDKVSNVRLLAVQNLKKIKRSQITMDMRYSLQLLKKDEDKEVKQAALQLDLLIA